MIDLFLSDGIAITAHCVIGKRFALPGFDGCAAGQDEGGDKSSRRERTIWIMFMADYFLRSDSICSSYSLLVLSP